MAKFQKGNPGKPKGAKNKKKAIKVADFVAANNINVAQAWWETIMAIIEPIDKANAIEKYYKYIGAPPLPEPAQESETESDNEPADVLSIIK